MSLEAAQWNLKRIKADLDAHVPFAVDDEWLYLFDKLKEVVDALIVEYD